MIIKPIYDGADSFINGLATVYLDGKTGCIDKNGDVVIPFKYDYINSFWESDILVASLDNKVALMNTKGELLFEPKFEYIELGSGDNMFAASYVDEDGNRKNVFINKQGEIILNTDYTEIYPFYDSFATIYKSSKCGILASNGIEVVPPIYDEVYNIDSSRNIFQVCLNGKWGLYNKSSNKFTDIIYDEITPSFGDIAPISVKLDNQWFYIDENGNKLK